MSDRNLIVSIFLNSTIYMYRYSIGRYTYVMYNVSNYNPVNGTWLGGTYVYVYPKTAHLPSELSSTRWAFVTNDLLLSVTCVRIGY